MSDRELPDKIKGLLILSDVVRSSGVELKRVGRKWTGLCPFHNEKSPSFDVNDERGSFKCYGCGKQGDVLTYIELSGRLADFVEVLRRGCELAGLDFERERGGDPERMKRARRVGDVLTKYMEVGQSLWDATRYVQAKQRKAYLVEGVIKDWGLGVAPSLAQCERAGLTAADLRLVGLLRPGREEFGGGEYMHFRDSILIPHIRNGRVTYIADRALTDRREKKILNLPAPGEDGIGGVSMPAHFNLEALWDDRARDVGVLLVEARLDAIACTERGHPAVAFLSSPTPAFAAEVAKVSGVKLYYCPDGTVDMTAIKRAEAAGLLGWDCRCCRLPDGKDPDDMSGDELAAVKASAVDCVEEWFGALGECGDGAPKSSASWRNDPLDKLAISPAALAALNGAGIGSIGDLQNRIAPNWNVKMGIKDGMAQAVEAKLHEYIEEKKA